MAFVDRFSVMAVTHQRAPFGAMKTLFGHVRDSSGRFESMAIGALLQANRLRGEKANGYFVASPLRTISTEQYAARATDSATLPNIKRCRPLRPCDPSTMRSARHSLARSTIPLRGSASITRV